jgi:hypothetical protein
MQSRITPRKWGRLAAITILSGVLFAAIAGSCNWSGAAQPSLPTATGSIVPTATPTPAPTESTTASASSQSPPSTTQWGPLAVIPPQDGSDTARTEGTVRITESCVVLETTRGLVLLVWPAARTAWNAESRTVTFRNEDGSTVSVGEGARLVAGGGGDSNEESGTTTEAWLASTRWVARPAASCPLESRWTVGELRQ